MIHVVAVITTKPGKRDEVLRHFRAIVPAVKAEQGCGFVPLPTSSTAYNHLKEIPEN